MISARKDFPAANLKELIAWVKANPGKVGVGNVGPASGTNVNAIYFQNITGGAFPVRAAQERADRDQGADLGRARSPVRSGLALAVVSARGHDQGLMRVTSKTRTVVGARRADHRRRRAGGLPQRQLVRPVGAERHAEGYRRARSTARSSSRWPIRNSPSSYRRQGLDLPPADQRTPEALGAFHKSEIEKWWPILQAAGIKAK